MDVARTKAFVTGLRDAIHRAQSIFPGQRIRVIYAGTGPFAALSLLCCPFFDPSDVGFTLIDVHPCAVGSVEKVYQAFGVDGFIDDLICGDATTLPQPSTGFHVAIAEVMQRALAKEPQVAVTRTLATQLAEGGILVPESIRLDLALFRPHKEYDQTRGWTGPGDRDVLGTIFTMTKDIAKMPIVDGMLNLGSITAPANKTFELLHILTNITTFEGTEIAENESGLTTVEIARLDPALQFSQTLNVAYKLDGTPGLQFSEVC